MSIYIYFELGRGQTGGLHLQLQTKDYRKILYFHYRNIFLRNQCLLFLAVTHSLHVSALFKHIVRKPTIFMSFWLTIGRQHDPNSLFNFDQTRYDRQTLKSDKPLWFRFTCLVWFKVYFTRWTNSTVFDSF